VIADATEVSLRGRAFGFHRAMDHAGAMTGPVIAAALIGLLSFAPREVILWSAVPGVLAVGVVWWALRRELEGRPSELTSEETRGRPSDVATASNRTVGLVVIFAFVRFPEALFLLRLLDLEVPVAVIPLLWAMLHMVRTGASYPGGVVSDRLGPTKTMTIGWLIYAAVCLGLATAVTPLEASCWFLGFGLVAAATEAPERALVAAWGGRRWRARRFGIYHASTGLAALPGGLAFGALYATVGAPTALYASAALAFALTGLGYGGRSRSREMRAG
jgi:MFS family permease